MIIESVGFTRVRRRSHDERHFQQVHLPPLVRRQVDAIEPRRVLGQARGRLDVFLAGPSVDGFGVFGNVGLMDPSAPALPDAEP